MFQRPQHLMSRFARDMNVIYWEEPVDIGRQGDGLPPGPRGRRCRERPHRRPASARGHAARMRARLRSQRLLDAHVASIRGPLIAWYYTPMMLPFSRHLDARRRPSIDAMDELSKFRFAPAHLLEPRAGADRPRRRRLHRRLEPVRGEEGPPRQRPLLPVVGRPRAFRQGARAAVRPGRPGGPAAAAARLLRRDRRALRHRAARPRSPKCAPTGRS